MNIPAGNTNKSLRWQGHELSKPEVQLELLNNSVAEGMIPDFSKKLAAGNMFPLKPTAIDILQVNVGKMCNQTCKHCHVDAGPDRKEIMTRETMGYCLDALRNSNIQTIDLTGGAPEMNPDFRWFVEEIKKLGRHVIVRCNLTIILANKKYHSLPAFFAKHNIEVVSSLPFYNAKRTDSQRGNGVFDLSIKALQLLNEVGYGKEGTGLALNLVYNPTGSFLPGDQETLEADFKRNLKKDFDIEFNHLFSITNMPISRYLEYLVKTDNYEAYMQKLTDSFNIEAAKNLMCRNTLSIGWDGLVFDCDFNQMLELSVKDSPTHIKDFDLEVLSTREIVLNQHCFGCTAGAGSSCGGEITK